MTYEIRVRRTQPESAIVWLFDWLGTRWEAQAFADGVKVWGTHAYSNTRRGAIRKARKRSEIRTARNEWEPV